ncbi:MAG: ferritin [Clostridia bacterium]
METELLEKMNDQITKEIYSGYIYLGMAAHFEEAALPGFAHWMKRQAAEELEHAMKIFEYLTERGQKVVLGPIEAPRSEYGSTLEVFEAGLEHERYVSALIRDLYELALEVGDHATAIFLQWFVTEQVEEEDSFRSMIDDLQRIGTTGNGLYMLDRAAGSRE